MIKHVLRRNTILFLELNMVQIKSTKCVSSVNLLYFEGRSKTFGHQWQIHFTRKLLMFSYLDAMSLNLRRLQKNRCSVN